MIPGAVSQMFLTVAIDFGGRVEEGGGSFCFLGDVKVYLCSYCFACSRHSCQIQCIHSFIHGEL